jgi:hypothetical protein
MRVLFKLMNALQNKKKKKKTKSQVVGRINEDYG